MTNLVPCAKIPHFLTGGGETGALMPGYDWSDSPLGPPDSWPAALSTAVSLMLGAVQPVSVWWGPDLISLYNDGYLPIDGDRHPAVGAPFAELWSEIWDDFRPVVAATLAGTSEHFIDLRVALAGRPGSPTRYFTFSYTALRDDNGAAAGIDFAAIRPIPRGWP